MRQRVERTPILSFAFDYHRHRDRLQASQNAPIIPTDAISISRATRIS